VALEVDCPYVDHDQPCGASLAPDWWMRGKLVPGEFAISDPTQILALLDAGPLAATFQVPQSFMNYTGGIYTSLGPQDPIVGGHGVGEFGYAITPQQFRIMRNQWGTGWGQNCVINGIARPGWFMIDPALLDATRYQLLLSNQPVPAPPGPQPNPPNPPAPSPPTITTKTLPSGKVGKYYSTVLQAAGGTPPYRWSISSGPLPNGLILSSAGGLTGNPTVAGTTMLLFMVTDSVNNSNGAILSLVISKKRKCWFGG